MTRLNLDDIDRWNPSTIRQVFEAATGRATGTRTAGAELGKFTTFFEWHGDAAAAAYEAANRVVVDFNAHADVLDAVAAAAESAADRVEAVKTRLAAIRAEAASSGFGITIDNPTNDVRPPADVARRPNARVIQLLTEDLQRMVTQVVTDAELADDDLAAAIRAADGALTPAQVADQLDGGPIRVPFPPSSADPVAMTRWWNSMNPQQQGEAVRKFGDLLCNVDGIPPAVRTEINIRRLPGEIARQEAIAGQAITAAYGRRVGPLAEEVKMAEAKLADLRVVQETLAAHPDAGLLLLDTTSQPDRVLAATYLGDLEHAKNVSVTTPGMGTRVSRSLKSMTDEAAALREQAIALANGQSVASVAWIGYRTPDLGFDVADDELAKAGAARLNSLYRGLDATTQVADLHLTALGHSYGSLTTSLALQAGAPVDSVVLYGSPGADISNASDLGVAPRQAFYQVAVGDEVAIGVAGSHRFGGQIQDVPGMVPLATDPAWGPDPDGNTVFHEGSAGHSEYPRMGSNGVLRTSSFNMAAIVAANPDAVIDDSPEPVSQTIPGARGVPITNPDYHS